MNVLNILSSTAVTVLRGGAGMAVGPIGKRPEKRLQIYEFEGCPFCRKAREALSILDLEADVHPCPKGGERYRPEVVRRGGKAQFPWLVDPNTGVEMYESDDIVRYLFDTYGDGNVHWTLAVPPLATLTAMLSSIPRPGIGGFAREARAPEQPLELWSFEASPFCRIVREALCTMEIPYVLHNVAKGSPSRDAFVARSGKMQVPYLVDPNTDSEMFESDDILVYLERTYGAGAAARAAVGA
ncbi:MAG: glutathione S-transferase N-terminal domain-containing protein [Candidatus Binatia bacterium]|nr:glutathione S-transferase N-terminal domain-containing protein [Candidatus Binatia bacterium]